MPLAARGMSDTESSSSSEHLTPEMASMDRLLQKQRSEIMYELRRIQHGERPVSGTDSREQLESFFAKRMSVASNEKENAPANVDSVEQHRPESIVVEVSGLFEQRRVSSILQSARFRQNLENIIRGSLGGIRRNEPRRQSPADTTETQISELRRAPSQTSIVSSSSSSSHPSDYGAAAPRQTAPNPVPPVNRARIPQPPPAPNSLTQQNSPLEAQVQRQEVQPPSDNHTSAQQQQGVPVDERWIQDARIQQQVNTWGFEEDVRQEALVQEISELLHRQLVTSALEGDSRPLLEMHIQNRLANTNSDGRAVQQFIQALPPAPVPRNDFSHLGIPPPQGLFDNMDNISVVSATTVPYQQTNTYLSREMQIMKAQMEEMKNMLKVSFELQMDIQRAIRQEVSAALVKALGSTTEAPPTVRSPPVDDSRCLICLDANADSVLYQCGHLCMCHPCGLQLKARGSNCPVCRAPIKDIIRAYKCNKN
ncbi:uncharacterized protein LOC106153697 [Lingula anatina]|uniref:Uncharacterized protein LOC106153697 n=1 Tax=Lingula anatina TaxID=7574 RepID=A0A1S3HAW7_LINAN|nr:uncharacterized protein LOC106153697 [Lingula anatina]|eukprot:XP_013383177.1 uncharacterized protein LOC106153697 [Lingula anatina]